MLTWSTSLRVFASLEPTDMRKSFDGLIGLVRSAFDRDPREGSWFLFFNKRRDRLKILAWEADGFLILYKRLEAETGVRPAWALEAFKDPYQDVRQSMRRLHSSTKRKMPPTRRTRRSGNNSMIRYSMSSSRRRSTARSSSPSCPRGTSRAPPTWRSARRWRPAGRRPIRWCRDRGC